MALVIGPVFLQDKKYLKGLTKKGNQTQQMKHKKAKVASYQLVVPAKKWLATSW